MLEHPIKRLLLLLNACTISNQYQWLPLTPLPPPPAPLLAATHQIFEPMQLSSDDDDDDVCIFILATEQTQCLHLTMNTRRMSANSSGRTCPHIVSGHQPKWSSEGFIMNNSRKPLIARPPQSHFPPFYSN